MKALIGFIVAIVLACAGPAYAQVGKNEPVRPSLETSAETMAAARRVVISGRTEQMMVQLLDQLLPTMLGPLADAHGLTQAQRDLVLRVVGEELRAESGPLVDMIALAYAQRLSVEDMIAIAEFYESAAGQRFLDTLPQMQADLGVAAERWGQEVIAPRIRQRFEEMQRNNFEPT